jgi:hypothetical protein
VDLLRESGSAFEPVARQFRIVDGTVVKEPGKTASQWRILYSIRLPTLACDCFEMTSTRGKGNGESFQRLPVRPGELIIGDAVFGQRRGSSLCGSETPMSCCG